MNPDGRGSCTSVIKARLEKQISQLIRENPPQNRVERIR
jgi:hypothetical protein